MRRIDQTMTKTKETKGTIVYEVTEVTDNDYVKSVYISKRAFLDGHVPQAIQLVIESYGEG